jgi:hypothetical protein
LTAIFTKSEAVTVDKTIVARKFVREIHAAKTNSPWLLDAANPVG